MSAKLFKITLLVMAASVVCKITGFIREISLASYLGISEYTDAYLISAGIASDVFYIIFASIGTMFLPLYMEVLEQKGKPRALFYMNSLMNTMLMLSIIVCILGMVLAKPLIRLMAVGFNSDLINVAAAYTRIMFPAIIALGVSNLISAYLQANDNFVLPAVVTAPTNIIVTASIFLSICLDSTVLVYGTLAGLACQLLIQLPAAYGKGYRYRFALEWKDIMVIRTVKMAIPMLISTSVRELNVVVDRSIATTLCIGSVAALNFAHKIDLLVFSFFSLSFSAIIYRKLSELTAKDRLTEFSETISKSISILTMLILPITLLIMLSSGDIVAVMYKRGNFGEDAVHLTSTALYYYAAGIFGLVIMDILNKAFFSLKDTRAAMINGIMSFVFNTILSMMLAKGMGLGGIALANSMTLMISAVFLMIVLSKKVQDFKWRAVVHNCIKIFLAAAMASLCAAGSRLLIAKAADGDVTGHAIQISVSIIVFVLIYIPALKHVKAEGINMLVDGTKVLLYENNRQR